MGQEHKQEPSLEVTLETGYGTLSMSLSQYTMQVPLLLIHMAQDMPTQEMLALSASGFLFQSRIEYMGL